MYAGGLQKLAQDWISAWEATDYSWDGLRSKPWRGWQIATGGCPRPADADTRITGDDETAFTGASLQDYWRSEESTLLKHPESGRLYTRFHYPRFGPKLAPGEDPDTDIKRLENDLWKRIWAASGTVFEEDGTLIGADNRPQLDGIVLPFGFNLKAPDHKLRLRAVDIWISGTVQMTDVNFGRSVDLMRAFLASNSRFERCSFSGYARFRDVTFGGNADYEDCYFAKQMDFKNAYFASRVSFRRARCLGTPSFEGCTLHPDVTFDGSRFDTLTALEGRSSREFWYPIIGLGGVSVLCAALTKHAAVSLLIAGLGLAVGMAFSLSKLPSEVDTLLERQTRSFRHLSQILDEVRAGLDAARFHQLELRADRMRRGSDLGSRILRMPERGVSYMYDVTSAFGYSILRPLISVVVLVSAFTLLFSSSVFTDWSRVSINERLLRSLSLSLVNVFRPLSIWQMQAEGKPLVVGVQSLSERLITCCSSTAESLAAVTLLFLFGLALKRRYQL